MIVTLKLKDQEHKIQLPDTCSSEEHYIVCPFCSPSREPQHRKEKKLAVNYIKKDMPWRCNHCGESGYVISDQDYNRRRIKPLKNYNFGQQPSQGLYQHFEEKRKLSRKTIDHFEIRMTRLYIMDKKSKQMIETKCISYPYIFRGQVIDIKYKDIDKNFSKIKGADRILYNIDSLKGHSKAYITEGEDDVSALFEIGIIPVVSVPNGVTMTDEERKLFEKTGKLVIKNQLNLDYLDLCINELEDIKEWVIATDDDPPGIKLREELARRFGKENCKYVKFSQWNKLNGDPCKDANDILIHHNKDELVKCMNSTFEFPIEDVVTLDDVWDSMRHSFVSGREKGLSIGFKTLDPHFTIRLGHPISINGFPNNGKTAFMFMIVLATSALYKWKWGIYSPENYPVEDAYEILIEMLVGNTSDISWNNRMTFDDYKMAAQGFIRNHIYFVDREEAYTPDELRKVAKQMIRKYGISGFVKDPWNALVEKRKKGENISEYLTRELSEEVRFATHNKIANVICVHPPTPEKNSNKIYKAPGIFDVDGGIVWSKKMYEMITVHIQDIKDVFNTNTEIHVEKVKNPKLVGITTKGSPVILEFNRRSNRYYEKVGEKLLCPIDHIMKELRQEMFGTIEGF